MCVSDSVSVSGVPRGLSGTVRFRHRRRGNPEVVPRTVRLRGTGRDRPWPDDGGKIQPRTY